MPAWDDFRAVIKDNPSDYYSAFTQMIYAMKYLRGEIPEFEKDRYDVEAIMPWKEEILRIIIKRQLDSCADWKAFGEKISGHTVEDFDIDKYKSEYIEADKSAKESTYIGKFTLAAMAQKSMVTNRIFSSGNRLAGRSIDYEKMGFKGIRDYAELLRKAGKSDD